jgi:uncharacterized protein (DUF885 family)
MKLSPSLLAGAAGLALLGAPAPALALQEEPPAVAAEAGSEARAAFDAMIDEITMRFFREAPEFATALGLPEEIAGEGYNARLSEAGPEADARHRLQARELLAQLDAVEAEALDHQRQLTLRILRDQVEAAVQAADAAPYGAGAPIGFTPYPVTQLSGPHIQLPNLMQAQQAVTDPQSAEDYLSRLSQYGRLFDQTIAHVRRDAEAGVTPPTFAIEKAIGVIESFIEPAPTENVLYTSFAEKLEAAEVEGAQDYLARAEAEVSGTVYPAYERLAEAMAGLLEQSEDVAGVHRLPNGAALYEAMIRINVDNPDWTAGQIHQTGLDEVARIHAEMEPLFAELGLTEGTIGERIAQFAADEQYLYPNTDEGRERLLADLNAQMAEIEPLLPQWFATIPPQPVEVRRVPEFSEASAPGGYYNLPSLDGSRPGIYWINLRDTAIWPSWSLKTLTYHEANPGHHFQLSINLANEDTPLLRKLTASTNAFAEGWALYSELLAEEMGLYEGDPAGNIGRLQAELFRAVRLVVDTGMHAMEWSREDAIEYMVDNGGVTDRSDAVVEIERYAVWPGQALGYKMGMIQMVALRERAETELGDAFDIREFHDALLVDGGMPMTVMDAEIERWIDERR